MMHELNLLELQESVGQVLEETAFICVDPEGAIPQWPERVTVVSMRFTGPKSGRLVLGVTEDLGANLAANLLGAEASEVDSATRQAAVQELLNIIAGLVLDKMFGKQTPYRLSVPEVHAVSPIGYDNLVVGASTACSQVTDEGQRIDLHVIYFEET